MPRRRESGEADLDARVTNMLAQRQFRADRRQAPLDPNHFRRGTGPRMKTFDELLRAASDQERRGDYEKAALGYRQLLRIRPNSVKVIGQLGIARSTQGRFEEALEQFDKVAALDPNLADNHNNRGLCLFWLDRYEEAALAFRRAWELDPDLPYVLGNHVYLLRGTCRWEGIEELTQRLIQAVRKGHHAVSPLFFMQFSDDPADLLACARKTASQISAAPRPRRPPSGKNGRIRLAYLSADYRDHAAAHCIAELIERHDRSRFEVIAISTGPDDKSAVRARVKAAFDQFIDVSRETSDAIAQRVSSMGVDILVDQMGHSNGNRMGVFALRPAPIQANYLGFACTTGATFIDYIIVDPFIVPPDQQRFFTEKLVHLPDCYWPYDTRHAVPDRRPTRTECGLPERGFVFASFNSTTKLTPEIFDIWMRLLKAVPGSVLWQASGDRAIQKNLGSEAAARGVDRERIVFAPVIPLLEHLARLPLADLMLDTLPWNAHTTASQALWMNLPIITCPGRSFHSRVAGSMLLAVGMPDLIAGSLEEYEALARALATEPDRLREVRDRLAKNRLVMPLFDTDRYRRHLEAAYETMVEIWLRGEPPRSISVDPI